MSWVNLLDAIYPVGAVYFSVLSTSPASIVGGTWTQLTGGLLGLADSAGIAIAGSNGGSNTITIEKLPEHTHRLRSYGSNSEASGFGLTPNALGFTNRAKVSPAADSLADMSQASGGGQDFIPAHSSVYCWRRTA